MKNETLPFDQSARNAILFANNMIYSILTTIKILEIQDKTPDYTTMKNLMLGNPELYRIVVFNTNENGDNSLINL